MAGDFLVSVRLSDYLIRMDSSKPICTKVPSFAEHFDYRPADRMACALRARGYRQAHVCDLDGMPSTPQSIADARVTSEVESEII
jgi:hypothetical protein